MTSGTVYFAHGKESGPWGSKITPLAQVAEAKGYRVISPDYSSTHDPDRRVRMLLDLHQNGPGSLVLAGSSMGGYVSAVASGKLKPHGLFLMAPALYIPGYAVQGPAPNADMTAVVHGWRDEVIPPEHSIRYAQQYRVDLHLVDGDHRLEEQIPFLEVVFGLLLDRLAGENQ